MDNCCKGWGRHQVAQTQTCLIYQKSVKNPHNLILMTYRLTLKIFLIDNLKTSIVVANVLFGHIHTHKFSKLEVLCKFRLR